MVHAVHRDARLAQDGAEARIDVDADLVSQVVAAPLGRCREVVVLDGVGVLGREVLIERPAAGDVDHLNAAANRRTPVCRRAPPSE